MQDTWATRGFVIASILTLVLHHTAFCQTCATDPSEYLYDDGNLIVFEGPVVDSLGPAALIEGSRTAVAINAFRFLVAWRSGVVSPGDQNYQPIFVAGFSSDDGDCIHDPHAVSARQGQTWSTYHWRALAAMSHDAHVRIAWIGTQS